MLMRIEEKIFVNPDHVTMVELARVASKDRVVISFADSEHEPHHMPIGVTLMETMRRLTGTSREISNDVVAYREGEK